MNDDTEDPCEDFCPSCGTTLAETDERCICGDHCCEDCCLEDDLV